LTTLLFHAMLHSQMTERNVRKNIDSARITKIIEDLLKGDNYEISHDVREILALTKLKLTDTLKPKVISQDDFGLLSEEEVAMILADQKPNNKDAKQDTFKNEVEKKVNEILRLIDELIKYLIVNEGIHYDFFNITGFQIGVQVNGVRINSSNAEIVNNDHKDGYNKHIQYALYCYKNNKGNFKTYLSMITRIIDVTNWVFKILHYALQVNDNIVFVPSELSPKGTLSKLEIINIEYKHRMIVKEIRKKLFELDLRNK
jgi:hypothetical protein